MFDVPNHKPNNGLMHVAEDRPTGYSVNMALNSPPVAWGDADHLELQAGTGRRTPKECVCVSRGCSRCRFEETQLDSAAIGYRADVAQVQVELDNSDRGHT